jgi:hypothetical protein
MKHKLTISGKTDDGKDVFSDIFWFTETFGLSLYDILIYFEDKNAIVDWIDFYESALNSGMKSDKIITRIKYDTFDVFGKEKSEQIITILNLYIKRKYDEN